MQVTVNDKTKITNEVIKSDTTASINEKPVNLLFIPSKLLSVIIF